MSDQIGTLRVKNFERFQHYKDRNPPWIKLYNDLLDDYAFGNLPDASKAHLIAIWLLASRYGNEIPHDAEWIGRRINASSKVDLAILVRAGFLISDQECSEPLADCTQNAMPEREREGETETEEERVLTDSSHSSPCERMPLAKAFENYNLMAGDLGLPVAQKLTPERSRHLRARLQEHGIEDWNQMLYRLSESDFLCGRNGRAWRANFDWLCKPSNFNKVFEGSYANTEEAVQ